MQAGRPLAQQRLNAYRTSYHNLSTRAAQRVTRFYKVRHTVTGETQHWGAPANGDDRIVEAIRRSS